MNTFDDADDFDDPELPDPSDMDQDDDEVLSRCPFCKKMIAEDSEVCPYCANLVNSGEVPQKYPIWFAIGVGLAVLAIFVAWVLHL